MLTDLQIRELCLHDFYFFVRYMNRTPKGVAPVSEDIHGPLCDYYGDPKVYRGGIAMGMQQMLRCIVAMHLRRNRSKLGKTVERATGLQDGCRDGARDCQDTDPVAVL